VPEEIKDLKAKKVEGEVVTMVPCKDGYRHDFDGDGGKCIHCGKTFSDIMNREEFYCKE
jgi:hypothetical protein